MMGIFACGMYLSTLIPFEILPDTAAVFSPPFFLFVC